MNYSLLLLIFFIFLFPFSYLKKLYLIDAPSLKIPKIINLSICLLLIIDLATEDSNLRTLITNFSEFKDYYFMDLGGINKWIMFIGKIILLFVNFYLIVVIYNLVRRNRQYRVIFIRVLIFYIPLKSLDLYRVAFDMSNESWQKVGLVSLLATMIFIIPILIFYKSKAAKRLMINDSVLKEQFIHELKTK